MKKALIIIAVVIVIGGGAFALANSNKNSKDSGSKPASGSSASTDSGSDSQTAEPAATGTEFTINANDDDADLKVLNVKKGDTVKVTFKIDTERVYYGGMEFRSDVVNTGEIKPGDSKTVTFVADKSFDLVPYWPASDVKKDYVVAVKVQ